MSNIKYARYSLETLLKWRDKADCDYVEETLKKQGGWGDGMRLSKLPTLARWNKLRDKLNALNDEIALRNQQADGGKK